MKNSTISINMAELMELTELDFNSGDGGSRSSNFGGGLELLMNDKVKDQNRPTSDINLDDLNKLEDELNELSGGGGGGGGFSSQTRSDFFDTKPSVSFHDDPPPINLNGFDEEQNKTWDGFSKFNNIPMNPDKQFSSEPKLTKDEMLKEKFKYLRKLEGLEKKGVELSKKYSMESSLQEMIGEYDTIMEEKAKQNSVKFQGNMLMAVINGVEFLNSKFDNPFDIKLDGWGEQVQDNITDYDDIFGELHEKYKNKGSMSPELKLLFQLGGSAMMVHLTNTMFKSSMPGMDDIFRQNPDLMRSFQNAAVNSMAQSNPGFSGFMNNVMNSSGPGGSGPPPPMATQGPNAIPPPLHRPGNNYARPDLNMSKGNYEDGIHLRENFERVDMSKRSRPEMKGPSDISDILSGLKTKTINIENANNNSNSNSNSNSNNNNNTYNNSNNNSTISINDLKDLQSEGNLPKRSARRKKSASNVVSLDI